MTDLHVSLLTSVSKLRVYPLPHGLAPSKTMVSDHGLNPLPSTVNPMHEGLLCLELLFSDLVGSCRPRAQGVGVDPCLLNLTLCRAMHGPEM